MINHSAKQAGSLLYKRETNKIQCRYYAYIRLIQFGMKQIQLLINNFKITILSRKLLIYLFCCLKLL